MSSRSINQLTHQGYYHLLNVVLNIEVNLDRAELVETLISLVCFTHCLHFDLEEGDSSSFL